MRKKKGVIITLALAGLISVGGAVGLNASMGRNMNEKQVAQVERKQETTQEVIREDANLEESKQDNTNQDNSNQNEVRLEETVNQAWNEEESIYLPEGAEIVSNDEYGCIISWDNCNISYMHYSNETQDDLGLGKLKPIIEDAVKKYSGDDLGVYDMEIFIEVPYDEAVEEQNIEADTDSYIEADIETGTDVDIETNIEVDAETNIEAGADMEFMILEDEGGAVVVDAENGEVSECIIYVDDTEAIPEEVRDIYYLDSKVYQVHIVKDNHRYDIWIDSLTGLVTVFNHEDASLGSFTNGWDVMNESGEEYQVSSEEQQEYDAIIDSFIADDLKLGTIEKFYAQDMGVSFFGAGVYNTRAYYNVICKTSDGAVVEVTFDIGEKKVTSFRTSAIYLSE